ncbi:MAG: monovalent cation/H+ antiporter complex subunit F [Dehalococcoidia bacterium]|nr:monovalent cation/H+ antiporter complex subunit F [Dehalococcoidia bacterium]MDH4367635.1 monovalent cation/H+ antiporter complex subunit F [Dehalococcoidia bacterium]
MIDWFPVIIALAVCLIIIMVRVFIGPGAPTRLVAFDTANTIVVTGLVVVGMMFNHVIFIDVAIVYALLSFVMTLYVAKYIQGDKF